MGVGVARIESQTSTALRYAQHDSSHKGQGPVWMLQRRFLAWKVREWCGCGGGVLGFGAGGVRKGLEGGYEDVDVEENGLRRSEGRF